MAKPKLALIPCTQGYFYSSVLPSDGSGDFIGGRSGKATRINSQGLIEEVSNGQSRLNYPMIEGKVVGCPHHILEPQRTNLVTHSEDFSNASWSKDNATITQNSIVSPDGTINASLMLSTNSNTRISDSIAVTNTFYVSVFVKYIDQQFIQIYSGASGSYYINFDIKNKLYQGGSLVSEVKFEDYGNGWLRLGAKFSGAGAAGSTIRLGFSQSLTSSYGNSGGNTSSGSSIYIWGFQLEDGSYPTSYIKTNGSAVTRSAETAYGSGNADTFNDSEGVLMAEISRQEGDVSTTALCINNGTLANSVNIYYYSANQLYFDIFSGSATISVNINIDTFNSNKIAAKYKSGDISLYVNGFELITKTNAISLSGLRDLDFNFGNGNFPFYGKAKQLQYYNSILTNSELEQLTSWTSFTDMAEGQLYTIE